MPPAGRRRFTVDERRRHLLEVALHLFSTQSYATLSIDEIAQAAGVSKGLLYHYFPGKRDLFVAVVRLAADQLAAATEPDPSRPADEALRATLDAYLSWVAAHAVGYRTLLRGGLGADEELLGVVEDYRAKVTERVLAGLEPTGDDAEQAVVVRGWVGFVEAATLEWLARDQQPPQARLRDLLTDALGRTLEAVRG
ncbi:MAG: TetR/AcrR family transcriptional regulator [Actinomycetes bacterium]